MRRKKQTIRASLVRSACLLILLVLGGVGCFSPRGGGVKRIAEQAVSMQEGLVWPSPPATGRIAHVASIENAEDLGYRTGWWRALGRVLFGTSGATYGAFVKPQGVAVSATGALCVTDTGAGGVHWFSAEGGRYRFLSGVGETGFVSPVGVAIQGETVAVADSGLRQVVLFRSDGEEVARITEGLERPVGVCWLEGRLYVSDAARHRIFVYDENGTLLDRIGERGTAAGHFNYPSYLTVAPGPFLLVCDTLNHRVQVLTAEGESRLQFGEPGKTSGHFSRPKGIAADKQGHIYVTDALFDNIQIFDAGGRFLLAVGGPGQADGAFWMPSGVATTVWGDIYVADSYNNRLQVFRIVNP